MTPVEAIALIIAVFTSTKLIMMLAGKSGKLANLAPRFWAGSGLAVMITAFLVAAGTLVFLLQELTIVQIWAAMFFSVSLIVMGLAPYVSTMREVEVKWHLETGAVGMRWFVGLVWMALSVWVILSVIF